MIKNFLLLVFALLVVFSGCSNKTNYSRKPVTNILITPSNKMVTLGNDFSILLQTKVKNGKLKNIDLFIDDQLITSTNKIEFSLKIDSKKFLPGNHYIKTVAYKTDGITASNGTSILILSDIVPKKSSFQLVKTLPHDVLNFTQGFEFLNDVLYEGTGNHGTSKIVAYKPGEGKIIKSLKIDDQYFGEGITILNDKIYQLTYKSRIGFVYDLNTFKKTGEFNFLSNEGWGLCNDGKYLIMSDGTSKIHFINPVDFQIVRSIEVCDNGGVIEGINELEYVDGVIFANIWTRNTILKIDAKSGKVLAYYNMESLLSKINNAAIDVLNGIAYNKNEDLFYVTGKFWPKIFVVKFE
jgi:glutaminyl-peptide cyclotransferase